MKAKIIASSLIVCFTTLLSPQVTFAYMGFLDVGINPVEAGAGLTSAASNVTSAVGNVTTATMSILEKVKHYALDPLAWYASKKIVQNVTAQTVNWINSGFEGNPGYVRDPGGFFLGVADDVSGKFFSDTGLGVLCSPFKAQVRLALVKNYLQENRDNYSCTLSILKDNFENFTEDFTQGGWEAWFELTQSSQNNPIGSYIAAQNELSQQVGYQQDKYQTQLNQGRGLLSWEACDEADKVTAANQGSWSVQDGQNYEIGDCAGPKKTVTPGSVIETQLQKALGSSVDQLNLADSFNEIVGALVTQMFTRVVGGGSNKTGLFGASNNPAPNSPSLTTQLVNSDSRPPANTKPNLVLNGANVITVRLGYQFRDPGYIAYDSNEGDLTEEVIVSNNSGGVSNAKCDFEPLLKAIASADQARNFNGVALTRYLAGIDKTDRGRLGNLSASGEEVAQYFTSVMKLSKILNLSPGPIPPAAPGAIDLRKRIGEILPIEELLRNVAMDAMSAHDDLAKGYRVGKVLEAIYPLVENGDPIGKINEIHNTFTVVSVGINTTPDLYCAGSANPPIGHTEGTYTILYTVTNSAGVTATTTRTVIVSATAPIGETDKPIDTLVGGNELVPPGGGGGGGASCTNGPHSDQTGVVASVKAGLQAGGMTWNPADANFECNRLAITQGVASALGASTIPAAGGCSGTSPDKILFSDGYGFDILFGGAADGAGPMWEVYTCPGGGAGGGGGGGGGTAPASLLEAIQTERSGFPASLSSLCPNSGGLQPASCPLGNILNAVAWANRSAGWGLNQKTSGHRCPSPAGVIACDVLHHNPSGVIYDVFIDTENSAQPTWGALGPAGRPFVAPVQP